MLHAEAGLFNSDGLADTAAMFYYGGSLTKWHVWTSDGSKLNYTGSAGWWSRTGYNANQVRHTLAGDWNGDGKTDLAALFDYGGGTSKWHVWRSNGSNFQDYAWWWTSQGDDGVSCSSTGGGYDANSVAAVAAGDWNNDGKDDVAALFDYGVQPNGARKAVWHVWITNAAGSCFVYQGAAGWWSSVPYNYDARQVRFAESGRLDASTPTVTGPDDIAAFYDYGAGGARWHVWTSNGSSAFGYSGASGWWQGSSYAATNAVKAGGADLSGDGLEDVAVLYDDPPVADWHAWRSLGGTSVMVPGNQPLLPKVWWDPPSTSSYDASAARHVVAGPFNSGAAADIAVMYRYGSGHTRWQVFLSTR